MKLLIISHTLHYFNGNQLVGWGPTIREIDKLATIFDEIVHIGFFHSEPAPESALPYRAPNLRFIGIPPSGGHRIRDKLGIIKYSPLYLKTIIKELTKADIVHVRCPANISLLAIILLTFMRKPRYRWVKYAGSWKPYDREPWSYRFQRCWLKHNWHRGVVTINGKWPEQPEHIYSFLNPCLTKEEVKSAYKENKNKKLIQTVRILFVGHLSESKGILRALTIVQTLIEQSVDVRFDIVGDGPLKQELEFRINYYRLRDRIKLHGWQPRTKLGQYYSKAHHLLFPSASEGWPKVLSEAMAYGVVPLAGAVSSIPQILGEIGTGRAIHPDNIDEYVQTILFYLDHPEVWEKERDAGLKAAPMFTYEAYLDALRSMFKQAWNLDLMKGSNTVIQQSLFSI